ncbi:MAG: hypothetical protein WC775_03585 [Patescibacteria group bacterium]|jgi:hypothetical protein
MRKTSLLGFSIPPELKERFEKIATAKHMTKSEMFRHLLEENNKNATSVIKPTEKNLATILKSYWDVKSTAEQQTLVIGLAIIVENGKVLIGARKKKDAWVDNLSWVFPGGKFETLNFEEELRGKVKKETAMEVEVKSLVSARIHPDSGLKPIQIIALYFYCIPKITSQSKPKGGLAKLKWVNPLDVFRYFTTSTNDEVTKFLATIEKAQE